MSIQLNSVSKFYGDQKALNNISFTAKRGDIIGLLGPNGAGKSTLMKILTGFLNLDQGTAFVNNLDVSIHPILVKKNIGYLPEQNPLYVDMYVKEYLEFQANIYKASKLEISNVLEKVGLQSESHKKIGQLSKGYQQRVGIAAAILHNPEVLILDEPTTGLDPNQLQDIRSLLQELGKEKTILFSTHIMQEVEAICNRVVIINKGNLLMDKYLKDVKSSKQEIKVVFDFKIEEQFILKLPNLISCKNNYDFTWYFTFDSEEDMRPVIFDFAKENGLKILELSSKNESLENLFKELTSF